MKSIVRNLARTRSALLLTGLVFGLSSCAAFQSQQPASPNGAASAVTATSTSSGNARPAARATLVPELGTTDSAEQQRLINEINRTGDPLNFPGFREEIPAPVTPAGGDIVELNYEQADLRLVLEELAEALDITILIDPTIDDKISIRTSENRPLTREDIWPLVRLLTRDARVTLERVGNVYNARKVSTGLPAEIVTAGTAAITSPGNIMQVTPLTFVSTDSATEVLAPLLEEGAITKLTNRNVLAISGSASQLERINQLLLLIDADPFANLGIQLFQLGNANATEVATELTEILTLIEGPNPAYQVKGIERINAILVTAPATRGFDEITRWVRILDADNQEQVEQLFHYRVKNLNAIELADTLSNVFEDENEDGIPRILGRESNIAAAGRALVEGNEGTGDLQSADNEFQSNSTAVSANLTVKIVADEATNSLLIRSTARDYRQLLTTINQLDSVPLQVMVNAVIAQVTLNEETKFGVDWSRIAADAGVNDISTNTSTDFLPGNLGGLMFSKSFVDGAARVEATLEAIAANNDVRLLARPSLTVINNQEGEIKIGAEIPVEQGESISTGGIATTNIQYRDTGITLTLTPQINDDGIVNLTISQILNSVDNSAPGVNNNPVFNNQEITTSVVVRDSENVVLGGLIQTSNELLNTGIPGLHRIPVLGNLFSYQQDLQERKELFIVLRPEIVDLNSQTSIQYSDILQRFELAAEMFEDAGI